MNTLFQGKTIWLVADLYNPFRELTLHTDIMAKQSHTLVLHSVQPLQTPTHSALSCKHGTIPNTVWVPCDRCHSCLCLHPLLCAAPCGTVLQLGTGCGLYISALIMIKFKAVHESAGSSSTQEQSHLECHGCMHVEAAFLTQTSTTMTPCCNQDKGRLQAFETVMWRSNSMAARRVHQPVSVCQALPT